MALYHFSAKVLSRSSRNTVGALAYRAGCKLYDDKTGLSFNYQSKPVEHVELLLPKDAPEWALDIQKLIAEDRQKGVQALCDMVESAETRIDAQVWREFEFALHRELTHEQNMALAREFVQDQICARGIAAQLNFHFDVGKKTGEGIHPHEDYPQEKPHCHVVMTTRRLEGEGLSLKKERDWNRKELLSELRVQWQDYSNFHLKLHGHDVQIDHRSHKERGIEIEPQPKMELNTVLRQKEDWQRGATVLFGKQETKDAIQKYADKGHVHIVEEKLPSFHEALDTGDREAIVKLYEISSRTSSLMFREMMKDCPSGASKSEAYSFISQHQDFEPYLKWKDLQNSTAARMITEGESYRPLLEARGLDPTKMAMLFVNKNLNKIVQQEEVTNLLKKCGLDSLVGLEKQPGQGIDVRQDTKDALIQAWHSAFKANPEKQTLMLAFSNRDVNDLNQFARSFLKDSGHISKDDFTYTISKMVEDDFGRKQTMQEEKNFSKGDRIVFTRNTQGLGVKNGTMGTITDLNRQTMKVKLDEDKEISFAPNLNPYFDQGWAITIHKSQGTTVDQTYLLASYEMTQNLAYVAMTRHRDNVHVFGSSLDFWRPEKLPEVLSKSGEKLSAGDYLDTDSLTKLMQKDDHLLTKIFERVSSELNAMGAVSKKAFWQVADHFLGIQREKEIRVTPDISQSSIREETRAESVLKVKKETIPEASPLGIPEPTESNFTKLTRQCEQRLHENLKYHNMALTPERAHRLPIQAERTAAFILHAHGDTNILPPEDEVVKFSLRAKYELQRLPEIQQELMEQGERNPYRAYRIADRLASIEGRFYFEARAKGVEAFFLSYDAKKELAQHREQFPHLIQDMKQRHFLSDAAAQHCAQDILRYKETHGENPSEGQMAKMLQISREVENKEYGYHSYSRDSAETEFLRHREGDLLFKHGLSYDSSRELDRSKVEVNKSFEVIQRQMQQEQQHSKQMEMGL